MAINTTFLSFIGLFTFLAQFNQIEIGRFGGGYAHDVTLKV